MKNKEDIKIISLLEEEINEEFQFQRSRIRQEAKANIQKIQAENQKAYDKKRKKAIKYHIGDLVAIQRTQFGVGLKLRPKFLGPYKVTKVYQRDRFFRVVAPNTFRLDSDETIAIAVEGKPSAMGIQDHPGKIKNVSETRVEVHAEQPSIFKVCLNPESFPPSFLTGNTEKFVLLTVSNDNFLKEIQIPNSAEQIFLLMSSSQLMQIIDASEVATETSFITGERTMRFPVARGGNSAVMSYTGI
ncbi:complement C3 [Caerostris darwini]|uniref:Complement C3 n=1 Tax=Caerostris darwini TaxID=1538125 RepID=A0AAV4NKV4_9ARAC|nr:complement C3 [Caerostris darwini]